MPYLLLHNLIKLIPLIYLVSISSCISTEKEEMSSIPASKEKHLIKILGSDTEKQLVSNLASEFMTEHYNYSFSVDGGGSAVGIEALQNGKVDIANSSRKMNQVEFNIANENKVNPAAFIFAIDALAIITHPKLGVDSLSLAQLGAIYRGEITNWKEVGGPSLKITLYGRNKSSGTYTYFAQRVGVIEYSTLVHQLNGNSDIVEAVKTDKSGIGYVGVGFIMDYEGKPAKDIWGMPIFMDGTISYSPFETNAIMNGEYLLTRPLYQFIDGIPAKHLLEFLKFELSEKGQEIVRKNGYFTINESHIYLNNLNGIYTNSMPLIYSHYEYID